MDCLVEELWKEVSIGIFWLKFTKLVLGLTTYQQKVCQSLQGYLLRWQDQELSVSSVSWLSQKIRQMVVKVIGPSHLPQSTPPKKMHDFVLRRAVDGRNPANHLGCINKTLLIMG